MDEKGVPRKMSREELAYVGQMYQNQHSMISNAISMALEELQELNSASKSLESMELLYKKESLNSIGGDFYIKSEIKPAKTVIVGVGGGYLIEKPIESAIETVKARIEKKNEAVSKFVKSRKELEAAMMDVQSRAEESSSE